MKTSTLLLLTLGALFVAPAMADTTISHFGDMDYADTKLIIGGFSHHFNDVIQPYMNEVNPSIGLEMWDIQAVYTQANSWGNPSLYLTYTPDYEINDYLTASLQVGIATGYECSNQIVTETMTISNSFCTKVGIIPMYAVALDYSPFANNFSVSVAVNHIVAMFSGNYKF